MPTAVKILLLLIALVILILEIAGTCHGDPPVTAIEIVPHQVTVGSDPAAPTTFELEARLWQGPPEDRLSITEEEGYKPSWKVTQPWLKVKSRTGFKAVIEVQKGAVSNAPGFVKATAGILTTVPGAKVSLVQEMVSGQDILKAIYQPGKSPDAVVSNGVPDATGTPCTLALWASVRRSTLGKLVEPCPGADGAWGAALLSVDHRLQFMPGGWTNSDDMVDAGPSQDQRRVLPLALHVMIGGSSLGASALASLRDDVLQTARKEIGASSTTLAETRAGIELKIVSTTIEPVGEWVNIVNCLDGEEQTASLDRPGILNVYYVDALGTTLQGLTCPWYEHRRQEVIYISRGHASSTFVHELGHVLGLSLPSQGHPDRVKGFDRTNVMTSGADDHDPGERRRLTVGQVFRMNVDSASWLNWSVKDFDPVTQIDALDPLAIPLRESTAPRLACQCGADNPIGVCPPLIEDVALPSGRVGSEQPWNCFDLLWLSQVPAATGEDPVAIVAGRPWGAPPRSCRNDLPGTTEKHGGGTFVKFRNLTRAGNCSSSVAIFFRQHGVLYLQLPEPTVIWGNSAQEVPVLDGMLDPIAVQVTVYHRASAADTVAKDVAHISKTFGSSNWSGIALDFKFNTVDSCQPPSVPFAISLCYGDGAQEGKLIGERAAEISLPKRTPTTASHFVGRALGLDGLTEPVFDGNIMRSEPGKRAQNLTLGQVFRISQGLLPSLYQCDPNCPPLSADVPR